MKILTLNTWNEQGPWRDRWEIILEGIAELKPDIIAFQEVFNSSWAWEVQKKIKYPHAVFSEPHSGLLLYSKYPIVLSGVEKLSPSSYEPYQRYLMWAELSQGKSSFFVFNTHLSWKVHDGNSRRRQLEELLELILEKNKNKESIVVGDFNATPFSDEMAWFVREGAFRDAYASCHPGVKGFTWDNRNGFALGHHHPLPDRRLDQVLVRGRGSVLSNVRSCEIVMNEPKKGIWASDHYGVLASFA